MEGSVPDPRLPTHRQCAAAGLAVGDVFTASRTFTAADIETFGAITRDYNPVHYEPRFTESKGLSGPILHGLLTAGLLCEIGGQLAWLASGMSFRFLRPVYPGDTVTCTLTITDLEPSGRASGEASYRNQAGDEVLVATLEGIVPRTSERAVLAEMIAVGDPTNLLG